MRTIELDGGAVRIVGALELQRRSQGIAPRRLPAWTRAQLPDAMVNLMVAMPSGVRLEFSSDASALELDALCTTLAFGGLPSAPAVFDLVVDGELHERRRVTEGNRIVVDVITREADVQRGAVATVRFEGLGSGMKQIELWLPHAAAVELRALRVPDGAVVEAAAARNRRLWVHYGSSISHCMEAAGPTGTWPAVAARLADLDLQSIGLAGQCHLDQFVARTIRDLPAELISLKLGINVVNAESLKERTFGPALHGFLDTVRDGNPETPLLVVSPIICPVAEDYPGPTIPDANGIMQIVPRPDALMPGCLTLKRIRQIIADIVEQRRAAGDANLHYLDGLSLFGAGDLADLPDGLHPNAAGYQRMGERFHALAFGGGGALA